VADEDDKTTEAEEATAAAGTEQPEAAATEAAETEAEAPAEAEDAKQESAEAEVEAEAAEAEGTPEPEDEQARPQASAPRRRGGEATAGRRSAAPSRRSPDADVTVRASARYVRCAPRKARLVIDHIRGKGVAEARAMLMHTPRAASRDVLKLLESAIANAENNHELIADELRVGKAYVDEGPTLKRYRPRAQGRATRIRKRTSHLTIELVAKG
jgi:ribosomal protein L22